MSCKFNMIVFFSNWRHRNANYPKLEVIFAAYASYLEALQAVLAELSLPSIVPKAAELSYVNWISDMSVKLVCPAHTPQLRSEGLTPDSQSGQWLASFNVEGRPGMTLTVNCAAAHRVADSGAPEMGVQLVLAFKAPMESMDVFGDLIGDGRNLIVQTFTDMTTEMLTAFGESKMLTDLQDVATKVTLPPRTVPAHESLRRIYANTTSSSSLLVNAVVGNTEAPYLTHSKRIFTGERIEALEPATEYLSLFGQFNLRGTEYCLV